MGRLFLAIVFVLLFVGSWSVCAVELRLVYDANGNLVTGDGKYRVYNSLNQLSRIYNGTSASDPLLEEYTYHPLEERVLMKKSYSGGSLQETTVYISKTFVQVSNSSGTFNYTYIYHEGQLIAQSVNGVKLFIHGNHEGSSSVVTNESGAVVERSEYSPFGEQLNQSVIRYGYEGKEYSSAVGNTDFNFRKYNPEWGLFTQPDSITSNVYNPQELNRYAFERNNPYKYIDPSGHDSLTIGSGGPYSGGGDYQEGILAEANRQHKALNDFWAPQLEASLRGEYDPPNQYSVVMCKGCKSKPPLSFEDLQSLDLKKNFEIKLDSNGDISSYYYKNEQIRLGVTGMYDGGFSKSTVNEAIAVQYKEKTGSTQTTHYVMVKANNIVKIMGKTYALIVRAITPKSSTSTTSGKSSGGTSKK